MKRLIFLSLFAVVLAAGQTLAADLVIPEEWTAHKAVWFALQNSPDSQVASQRILEAQALLQKAEVSFYPQVGLSAAYTQTNNPMYSFGNILNQGQFTQDIDFNNPGRTDNLDLALGAEYRFYNGGQDRARQAAAEAGIDVSTAEQAGVLLQLEFEAFRAFQRIVEAQSVHRARVVALDALGSALEVARARYEAGDLLKIDLLNLEVQLSSSQENEIQAAHNLELVKQIFLTLLGLPATKVSVQIAGETTPVPPVNYNATQRPELVQLQAALRAAEARLYGARGSKRPTIDGFASYQIDQGSVLNGSGDSWMAGVKVNFKLFDGHSASADISLVEAQLGRLRAELKKLELGLALEVKQAELALSQAKQRQKVTAKMVEQAAESEQLSRARFREGVILASDLIDVEARLTDARVRNALANSAVLVAIADLRRAAGLPQFEALPRTNTAVEIQP
jgi:outer membrane protein TolC